MKKILSFALLAMTTNLQAANYVKASFSCHGYKGTMDHHRVLTEYNFSLSYSEDDKYSSTKEAQKKSTTVVKMTTTRHRMNYHSFSRTDIFTPKCKLIDMGGLGDILKCKEFQHDDGKLALETNTDREVVSAILYERFTLDCKRID